MGAVARVRATGVRQERPPLRLVPARRGRTRACASAHAARLFRVVTICLLIIIASGAFRVAIAAQAAEAAIDAWELKAELKNERQLSRALAAETSRLAAPSRIEAIASEALDMTRPTAVCYLELPSPAVAEPADPPVRAAEAEAGPAETGLAAVAANDQVRESGGLLAVLAELAAGEAQAVLVGNMGLGSVR